MSYLEVEEWLNKMTDENFRNDIFNCMLTPYKSKIHQTVYIGANFVDYKHTDLTIQRKIVSNFSSKYFKLFFIS